MQRLDIALFRRVYSQHKLYIKEKLDVKCHWNSNAAIRIGRRIARRITILSAFSILLFGARGAAETMAETAARFEALGMPNVAGAEFAEILSAENHGIKTLGNNGNAWKISEEILPDGGRVAMFVVNGGEMVRFQWIKWNAALMDRAAAKIAHLVSQNQTRIRKQLEEMFARLRDTNNKLDKNEEYALYVQTKRMQQLYVDDSGVGQAFLFALQLHQHGESDAAEKIMRSLKGQYDADSLERFAREELSAALYRAACWRLVEHKDWRRFREEVQNVMRSAPEKWRWADAVNFALEQAQSIAEHGATPLPSGYQFSEDERELLKRLEAFPVFYPNGSPLNEYSMDNVLWLIPETWAREMAFASDAEREIMLMGMKAIPMLVALCEHPPMPDSFQKFPHHALRSEKARRILQRLASPAFAGEYQPAERDIKKFQEAAAKFHEQYKDASLEALALVYAFGEGGYTVKEKALDFIKWQSRSKRIPELEAHFKTVDFKSKGYWRQPVDTDLSDLVMHYAASQNNGQIIADFAARLNAAADSRANTIRNANAGDPFRSDADDAKARDRLREYADMLRAIDLSISDDDLRNACEKSDAREHQSIMRARLNAMPFKEMHLAALKCAQNSKYNGWRYIDLIRRRIENEGGVEKIKPLIKPTDGREFWLGLWTEDIESINASIVKFYAQLFDAEAHASALSILEDESNPLHKRYGGFIDSRGAEFMRKRFVARLDETPEERLPKLPWDTPFSESQRASVAAVFAQAGARQEAARAFAELPEIEREWILESRAENPALAQKLAELSREIVAVTCAVEGAEAFLPKTGERMSPEIIADLQRFCEARTLQESPVSCVAERQPGFGGWSVAITPLSIEMRGAVAGISGLACEEGRLETIAITPPSDDAGQTRGSAFERVASEIALGTRRAHTRAIMKFSTKGRY